MFASNEKFVTKYDYLSKPFADTYKWIQEHNLSSIPAGVYPIYEEDPEFAYIQVQEYTTAPWEEVKYEAHDQYFDVHYMIEGEEIIGVCRRELLSETEFIIDNDMHYFMDPDKSSRVYLKKGDMLVVAPEDAHKPRCCAEMPIAVRKICAKIRV